MVPVHSCTSGHIDRQLPVESVVAWRNRSSVDHVILLDWKCSATNLDPRGSIACLKDALVKVLMFKMLADYIIAVFSSHSVW